MPSPYQRQFLGALAADEEFDLRVFYYTASAADRDWRSAGLAPFEKVLDGRTLDWLGPSAHWNPTAVRELEAFSPELVVVSDYSSLTAQRVMRWLQPRCPWVFWGEVPAMRRRGPLGRALRWVLQRPVAKADAIAAIGSRAVPAYRHLGGEGSVVNIPYHCDTEPFARAAERARHDGSQVTVLFSGQMIERKGVDTLVQAFATVGERHDEARLTLIGAGPESERYRAAVPKALSERVAFLGFQQPTELPELFAGADLFVLPSRHDGWGVVINEALAAGLPIITTQGVAASDDLVREGVNGRVVPVDDPAALASVLDELISSAETRQRFGRASSAMAGEWTLAKGVERWRSLCRLVLEGKG